MRIRTRLTIWYAGVMFLCLLAMGVLTYRQFIPESRGSGPQADRARREEEADEGDFGEVMRILTWCGVPAGALALAGGWALMRHALAPIARLTVAAEALTERNLGEPLPATGSGDELDRLTEVFNAMTQRLHTSFARIREFTLSASHELKSPLTILCSEAESELSDETLSPERREQAAGRLEELRRLTRIVEGLTLLAKADAGLIQLTSTSVSFDELVRELFADTQLLAYASGLTVTLPECVSATVQGDRHRLRQLLLNLADNAVKYNQPGGSILLRLMIIGQSAEFVIANTGAGIPAGSLPRVFDRFFRGDTSHSQNIEGCGLGLSIAQWIVQAHGGTVRIASEPGKLTTVTVRLPLNRSDSEVN